MQHEIIINNTITYIEERLHESLMIEVIAEQAGFSKFHFHRIFSAAIGMSITDYIRMRRLANASTALLYSDERIIDIALLYHFESQEVFTRAFKRYYHLPPGQYRKLMTSVLKNKEEYKMKNEVKGWFLSGTDQFNYEMGIDHEIVHQGKASGYLKSKTVLDESSFSTMMQQFKADKFRGQRIKLSCFLKTKDVQSFSSMWMRVDNTDGDVVQFDNMSNRSISGSTNWNRYSIVLDIPENSSIIAFGVILSGQGHVWMDQFTFEEVDESVETTNLENHSELLDEPLNLSFEEDL
ncbi:helix-turn-helix transcriptional regulator [Kurthia zopfii]|uniref:helix-turn-helix transcriptional regulator n=1 Tax=Kurthia zopfii TaxID=1650 RepID=UPI000F705EC3|nr:helix-turn-helix transcriptional regulator [Kurthia zopfii]VEI06663.1 right oriC-binding transcriptional activator [Kurthia zopfii]